MSPIDIIIIIVALIIVAFSAAGIFRSAKHGECASCRRRSEGCNKCNCHKDDKSKTDSCDKCKK